MVRHTTAHRLEEAMREKPVHRRGGSRGEYASWAHPTAPRHRTPQDLVVQSTTSVRDSGLLDEVIIPQFQQRYPQWRLRVVAVGTGQAIVNARAGQGDVLITHAPALEQQFLADGFSLEPFGRSIMWNDYVIVGPANDPAGVGRRGAQQRRGGLRVRSRPPAPPAGRRSSRAGTTPAPTPRSARSGASPRSRATPATSPPATPAWYLRGRPGHGRHAAPDPTVPVADRLLHDHRPRDARSS